MPFSSFFCFIALIDSQLRVDQSIKKTNTRIGQRNVPCGALNFYTLSLDWEKRVVRFFSQDILRFLVTQ